MDIREFAQEFQDNVRVTVEMGNTDYDTEIAKGILEYMEDNGEVNALEICTFQKTRTRITAYDYNDEAESLDLFYLVKADTLLGKVNNSKVQQGFNCLQMVYEYITATIGNTHTNSTTIECRSSRTYKDAQK